MNTQEKQFRIGLVAVALISLHVLLCLFFVVAPRNYARTNRIGLLYRHLAVVGPFFTESKITSTPYLSIRTKKDTIWSPPRKVYKEHLAAYNSMPWKLEDLSAIAYESQLSRTLSTMKGKRSSEEIMRSAAFRELSSFLTDHFVETPVDSIQILSGVTHRGDGEWNSIVVDFILTYQPNQIFNAED